MGTERLARSSHSRSSACNPCAWSKRLGATTLAPVAVGRSIRIVTEEDRCKSLMIKDPVTFITGAGASVDYGFPLGGNLITKILEELHNADVKLSIWKLSPEF